MENKVIIREVLCIQSGLNPSSPPEKTYIIVQIFYMYVIFYLKVKLPK
jgi:hypothetical protein